MMTGGTASVEELGLNGEDRISRLPDSIIHHILSFLPSIKEAIQTCFLSKRWKNQWTFVPVLTFNISDMDEQHASRFMYNTLMRYGCYKIEKLTIYFVGDEDDIECPFINDCISFLVRKGVEEIKLGLLVCKPKLTECIFKHSSLVKLNADYCVLEPKGKVCWENLKELHLDNCYLSDEAIDRILCGSPLLESLVLEQVRFKQLVICSKFLKKLKLGVGISVLEISCPNLEELVLYLFGTFDAQMINFSNLTSLKRATLDFDEPDEILSNKILQKLHFVKNLTLQILLIMFLSRLEVSAAQSFPLLENKCLTVETPNFNKYAAGMALAIHCSHLIEKLTITKEEYDGGADSPGPAEIYNWYSNSFVFNCVSSHLKFVEIINFSRKDPDYASLLNFIEFLLKEARVLEKLVFVFDHHEDDDFEFEASLKLWCFRVRSQPATVDIDIRFAPAG